MKKRGMRRKLVGTVVSDKMHKTVIVVIDRIVKHPLYEKYIKRRSKYAVHDETNSCKVGDKVQIIETRPLSKTKRWRLQSVLKEAV